MKRQMNKVLTTLQIVAFIGLTALGACCAPEASSSTQERFELLFSDNVAGWTMAVVRDTETRCEYILTQHGITPRYEAYGSQTPNTVKGCQ
jgi:hypothetical protein